MWEQECRGAQGVAGWLLEPGALPAPSGSRVSGGPAPALTLSPCWPLLAAQGTSLLLEAVGQTTPSSHWHPTSRVELCGDSARQPGRRPQCPVWPLGWAAPPAASTQTHHSAGGTHLPWAEQRDAAAGPRGDSRAGKRTSGTLFPPCTPCNQSDPEGIPGNLPPCSVPQPAWDLPTHPWFPETEEEGMGVPGWRHRGPGLACAVLPDGAS